MKPASHKRMMKYHETINAYSFKPSEGAVVLHEEGSTYILQSSFIVNDPEDDYIWVFCEHQTDLIFHKDELNGWWNFETIPGREVN
jgi:hypothetical protein